MKRGGTSSGRSPARPASPRAIAVLAALLIALSLAGCDRAAPAKGEAGAGAAAGSGSGRGRSQAFIEAGNEAYRAADYELALKRYAAAAIADPRDPAAYFGMGMTFTRLKREDEARAAFARAQQLSGRGP